MDISGQEDAERGESESKSTVEDERNLERWRGMYSGKGTTERKAAFRFKLHALTSCPSCQSQVLKSITQKTSLFRQATAKYTNTIQPIKRTSQGGGEGWGQYCACVRMYESCRGEGF